MTDSPAVQVTLDPNEKLIYERILGIRDKLSLLKEDRSTYIRSQDVLNLYDQIVEQIQSLNAIRAEHGKPLEQNRVDNVLEDCFQLISLFFLTIGRKNEAPAVYSLSSTVKRLLDHLKESSFFSKKDLESANHTLHAMQETLRKGAESHSPHLLTLVDNRLTACRIILGDLQSSLKDLSPELAVLHERLISILRSISAANTRPKFPASEVRGYQDQLKDIQRKITENTKDDTHSVGREIVVELLGNCLKWAEIVLTRQGKIDEKYKTVYDKLYFIRNQLERLSLTQAWSLRETDLYDYQRRLNRIDECRTSGNFEDFEGNKADLHTQRTLLYLLRRSYAYIYSLIISSEPVSEPLLPIFNQLQTLRRCLLEVKRSGGVSSPRELYPYTLKLHSIDSMRVNGMFMVGSEIPEGQASMNSLLIECFGLSQELQVEVAEDS